MKKYYIILFLGLIFFSGCAKHYTPEFVNDPYGFFFGIWHGFIVLFSLVINFISWLLSLVGISFLSDVEIVGRPNTGFGYYIGFIIGLCCYSEAM